MRMQRVARGVLVALLMMLSVVRADAEVADTSRVVTSFYNLEVGSRRTLATYLSPVHYQATDYALSGLWTKVMPFNPARMSMAFDASVYFSDMLNPAGTASMINLGADFKFGMDWRSYLCERLQISLGGYYGFSVGAMWLIRNSNNPVEVLAHTDIGARIGLSYPLRIGRLPVLLAERVSTPLIGAFFSPAYGETFWEIYLGNRKGLIHCGWPGNYFAVDNLLSATLDFGRTAMQIGYRLQFMNRQACSLITRQWCHSLVVGVVPHGINLKNKDPHKVLSIY
ncbi:MAG: DUF3316 domain-containing protein [Muribaculum sp.]|nr:DUF3316 domain-containing protein [Muribaculum sp.]